MALERSFRFETKQLEEKIRKRLAETPLAERSIMRQIAVFIEKEAKLRAPVDQGFLTADIHNMVADTGHGFAAVVYVPVNCPSAQYATAMHENHYNLGPNSLVKQTKVGVTVGRKYLSRAIHENQDGIMKRIAFQLKKWGWK